MKRKQNLGIQPFVLEEIKQGNKRFQTKKAQEIDRVYVQ